jgi:radical SAM superfamily enzyme YgiQ (UPF0313 family)
MKKILILVPADKEIKNAVRDFVYGCWCRGRRIGGMQMPPLNLLYVTTVLQKDGFDAELIDASAEFNRYEQALAHMEEYSVVILLSSTNSFRHDVKTLRELKKANPDLLAMLFGSHPTFMADHCLQEDVVDIAVQREPEFIIRDVVRSLSQGTDWREVKGIAYRDQDRVVTNEAYPFVPMDDLPIPNREALPSGVDYFNPVVKRMPYTTMQTSRGCPAKCIFCTVPYFYGRKIRRRSVENVMEEIRLCIDLGYREIFFRDETFTAYKKRNIEICNRIIDEKLDITWIANARADMVDKEQLEKMKEAGCHLIKIGAESGCQQLLDNMHKGTTVDQTRRAFEMCREAGLDTHAHFMIGNVGETRETQENTIRYATSLGLSTASFGILTPYPGSVLFDMVSKDHPEIGDGSEVSMARIHTQGFFNEYFTSLSRAELEKYVRKAYRKFYLRPGYLWKKLRSIDSIDEFFRLLVAGSNIFSFIARGQN